MTTDRLGEMRRAPLFIAALATALAAAAQDRLTFEARLTPLPLDVQNRTEITGSGTGSAVLEGRRLRVSGRFEGMQGPATAAHLHLGPALGIRGGPVLDLDVDQAAAGRFSGEWELTAEQLRALDDGRLYIQIHSAVAPAGNLWGWLLP